MLSWFEDEEDAELSTIRLQAMIRGRATQNMMREGRDKRIELIKELRSHLYSHQLIADWPIINVMKPVWSTHFRSTHALQEAQQAIKQTEKDDTLSLQRKRLRHEHKVH